jgi:hypothetical protein
LLKSRARLRCGLFIGGLRQVRLSIGAHATSYPYFFRVEEKLA